MPKVTSPTALIEEAALTHNMRLMILIDQKTNQSVYANFYYSYDSETSLEAIGQMFDATLFKLDMTTTALLTEQDIPIIQHIGKWKTTIILRNLNNVVTVKDGENKPVDNYIGME